MTGRNNKADAAPNTITRKIHAKKDWKIIDFENTNGKSANTVDKSPIIIGIPTKFNASATLFGRVFETE